MRKIKLIKIKIAKSPKKEKRNLFKIALCRRLFSSERRREFKTFSFFHSIYFITFYFIKLLASHILAQNFGDFY